MTDKDAKAGWDVEPQMRDLILDMMCGLRLSGHPVREYCILKVGQRPSSGNRFAFYDHEYDDLLSKVNLMVFRGWIRPVSSDAEPIYRITDEFAQHLLEGWPERRWPDWWLSPAAELLLLFRLQFGSLFEKNNSLTLH